MMNEFVLDEILPSPHEFKRGLPITLKQNLFIHKTRQEIVDVLSHHDPRLLLIVGPCSIHDVQSAYTYAMKLKELTHEVSDKFLIIMRVYFEKPRSTVGWKGLLYDPDLNGSYNIQAGLKLTRELLLELAENHVATAAEFLDPLSSYYLGDLISWGCIGARTCESQIHRQLASGLPMPIAFKNGTSGNIDAAVHGLLSASASHHFIGINELGKIAKLKTNGNPNSHLVLRGGNEGPNYDPPSIQHALGLLHQYGLPLRLLIDCSHDNSYKKYENQPNVFQSVIHQFIEGERHIRGLLLESHLFAGNQAIPQDKSKLRYAVSLTDPCLDWASTERLVLWGRRTLLQETFLKNSISS